ncbi:hypothetical protein IWY39_000016 [Sphingobium sp. JAI105]|uniref:hypothetical protein n=1 Tax=Sphingobium sp. JAI105 TaxID=2787715 RepID=UPI0018CA8689|nr:hypothetical protein [Sphingobium sp. JAI105]MBG6116212.1 hypothetical protein [Sphingobium sp. JAI105]
MFTDDPIVRKGAIDRPGNIRSLTLKIACKKCNNGWMKGIVDESIPLLKPLTSGYWGSISLESQYILAKWIALFTMSFEYADRDTVCVSQRERDDFRRTGILSENWDIAIGYVEGAPGVEPTFHRGIQLWGQPDWNGHRLGQITAFVFGKMIAVASYSEFTHQFSFEDYATRLGLVTIWPIKSGSSIKKPFRIHCDDSVYQIIEEFSALLED